jgi:hypothetical protein
MWDRFITKSVSAQHKTTQTEVEYVCALRRYRTHDPNVRSVLRAFYNEAALIGLMKFSLFIASLLFSYHLSRLKKGEG